MFQVVFPTGGSEGISCPVSESVINGRDVIFLLTDAVHRIDEMVELVHTLTYRSVPTANVGDKENGRLMFLLIILVMAGHENSVGYRHGTYEDSSEAFFATFKELEMRGPRVAQIWMANNPELEDIHKILQTFLLLFAL